MSSSWNYDKHPNFSDALLKARSREALALLYGKSYQELAALSQDTRPIHREYFRDLTDLATSYFAGNYRGADFPCLVGYEVRFGNMVGTRPRYVSAQMDALADELGKQLAIYELGYSVPDGPPAVQLYRLAELAAATFVAFLTIHPYADGNGHMSRLIIIMLFARYAIRVSKMPLHPRPQSNPPLHVLLTHYRFGNTTPLVSFVLSCI